MAVRGGRFSPIEFPSFCGLIHHPQAGWLLFDTGYADHFFTATQHLPERLYRMALPVALPKEERLLTQLATRGLTAADISYVIVSHYHGDHVAGLRDFPRAKFIASKAATQEIQALTQHPWRATLAGKLPGLLPENFHARLSYAEDHRLTELPQWMAPFTQGFDLLGDGSLLALPLPGHSAGQLGLFIPDANGRPALLAADACWSLPACREGRLPSAITKIIAPHGKAYEHTFFQLSALANREPDVNILPSHCTASWRALNEDSPIHE